MVQTRNPVPELTVNENIATRAVSNELQPKDLAHRGLTQAWAMAHALTPGANDMGPAGRLSRPHEPWCTWLGEEGGQGEDVSLSGGEI